MKITLDRINDAYLMEATNERGQKITLDSSVESGGSNAGYRPMELLPVALGSCTSIDVISILKKQKQPLKGYRVEVNGEREAGKVPSLYTAFEIHYIFEGDLDEKKVKRAIDLSLEKYCSVSMTLEKTAKITYRYTINRK